MVCIDFERWEECCIAHNTVYLPMTEIQRLRISEMRVTNNTLSNNLKHIIYQLVNILFTKSDRQSTTANWLGMLVGLVFDTGMT